MADAPSTPPSPQAYARAGGALYLVIIVAGIVGELFVRGAMIVSGDPAATSSHIIASPTLWRAGIAGDVVMHLCDVGVMLALYVLLKPVSRQGAMLAVLFNLIQTAVAVANKLTLVVPLFLLGSGDYLRAFEPAQLQALAYLAIRLHDYGFGVALIFFGMECLTLGYLIVRSGYLPKALGAMMAVAGVCYAVNSFALVLVPTIASRLFPAILLPSFVAELSLAVWLVAKGVDLPVWQAKARASRAAAAV